MFSKLALFAVSAAAFVAAGGVGSTPASQCNTDNLKCCNSIQDVQSKNVLEQLAAIGVSAQGLTGQAALTCTPLTIVGASGNSWYVFAGVSLVFFSIRIGFFSTQQPVCCSNNNFSEI